MSSYGGAKSATVDSGSFTGWPPAVQHPTQEHPGVTDGARHCNFWRRDGSCKHGDSCKFLHSESLKGTGMETRTCSFWRSGTCKLGSNCRYLHTDLKKAPCKFWESRGICRNGEECRFEHGELSNCAQYMAGKGCRKGCNFKHPAPNGEVPLCRNFVEGSQCNEDCKLQHPTPKVIMLHVRGMSGAELLSDYKISEFECLVTMYSLITEKLPGEQQCLELLHGTQCLNRFDTAYTASLSDGDDLTAVVGFRCIECGGNHEVPEPSCYHQGRSDTHPFEYFRKPAPDHVRNRPRRRGGWDPDYDGMSGNWNCCGCDDESNKLCSNHYSRLCACHR
ncbi:Zc3h6 [Symbiodinium natans]|uniref:Zc3h6 protein n=1 Tax=Symbiodinium natans TaxID=878477 RepID=A0A812RLZ4_9DINO|nr:Zc3h6 [Symbiodinium natans]